MRVKFCYNEAIPPNPKSGITTLFMNTDPQNGQQGQQGDSQQQPNPQVFATGQDFPPTPPPIPTPPVTPQPPLPPPPPITPPPPMGQQPTGTQGDDSATQPEEDKTPANFKLGQQIKPIQHITVGDHSLNFDVQKFLLLLAGSISLSKDEKKRIITSIPKLRQEQIDELTRIFEEERNKFAELSAKHVPQLEKLVHQHAQDWEDIEMEYAAEGRKDEEAAKADEIRKQLGL